MNTKTAQSKTVGKLCHVDIAPLFKNKN